MSATTISQEEYVQECKMIAADFLLTMKHAPEGEDISPIVTEAREVMRETIEHSRTTNLYRNAAMVLMFTQNPNAGMSAAVENLKSDKDPQALDMICFLAKHAMGADIIDCISFVDKWRESGGLHPLCDTQRETVQGIKVYISHVSRPMGEDEDDAELWTDEEIDDAGGIEHGDRVWVIVPDDKKDRDTLIRTAGTYWPPGNDMMMLPAAMIAGLKVPSLPAE